MSENITPDVVEETPVDNVESVEETPSDAVETESAEGSQSESQAQSNESWELTVLGEKKTITDRQELINLAQQGSDYARVKGQLEELRNDPGQKWLQEYMKESGYSNTSEFVKAIDIEKEQRAVQTKVNELMANDGFTESQAKRIAEAEAKASKVDERLNGYEQKDKENQEYLDFINWYEGKTEKGTFKEPFDSKNIPEEVWTQFNSGVSLKTAYMEYALDNLKTSTQQEVLNSIKQNADTSTGSTQNNPGVEDQVWSRDFIEKTVNQMGSDEARAWVKANSAKIEESGYYN